MKHTYEVKLTDKSIDAVIQRLEALKKAIPDAVFNVMDRLLELGKETAEFCFGSNAVQVTTEVNDVSDNSITCSLVANGFAVYFLEFGTGFWTDEDHDLAKNVTEVSIEKGSWSRSPQGAGTFDDWDENMPDAYPYNHHPKYGMLNAYNAMYDASIKFLKEEFKNL